MNHVQRTKAKMRGANKLGYYYPGVDCSFCGDGVYLGKLYAERAPRRYRVFKTKAARAFMSIHAYRWLGHRYKSLAFKSGDKKKYLVPKWRDA